MSGLEFSPGNTRYTVCGSTVCLLAVVVGFTKEGHSVWCAGHQLIVVVLLLHLRVCRVKSCGLADGGVNAVRSVWLLIRQGIKWGFRKSLRMVGHGVRAFQKAKRGCGEPRNGCVAIACLLATTNNLV